MIILSARISILLTAEISHGSVPKDFAIALHVIPKTRKTDISDNENVQWLYLPVLIFGKCLTM